MSRSRAARTTVGLTLTLVLALAAAVPAQTPPDKFLGHKVGEDRKLADYDQITKYFRLLDQESPKLQLVEIGRSVQDRPILMAVITAPENMARLDEFRETARRLKTARGLAPEEARRLAASGKTILLITCSLHATEIAASQMSMEFAYDLVTGRTFFDADAALRDVIVLLVPSHNPDGNQMVVDWYRKYLGTKFEGGSMPWLYHVYAGHDNNRDWFMFNLPETRAVTKVLYHDWFPQIHIDEHQMGSNGARLFVPPFMDPPLPNINPLVWRGVNLCGVNMAYDLQNHGLTGVVNGRSYTAWWIGACDDTSWLHNTIGLLSEMASVRTATPVHIEPTEIPASFVERRMDFVDPWPGGWWRLRDLVDYELVLSKSLVKTAALHREDFLYNSYRMSQISIEKTEQGQPYAFVIPAVQRDYPTTLRLLDILKFGGVEIHQAEDAFIADGRWYPAGSFVVPTAQPYKAYAWALLETQEYPDIRQYPGGPPVPPYDNAAWTLPLQMGVACDEIPTAFSARLKPLAEVPRPAVAAPETPFLVFDARANAAHAVMFGLLAAGAEVWRSAGSFKAGEFEAPAGSFIVRATPEMRKALAPLLDKWRIEAHGLAAADNVAKAPVKNPRIGLYQSWRASMDEGWTRYMLDDLGIPYKTLHNADIKGVKGKKVDLRAAYDVILFASESADVIKTGRRGSPPGAPAAPARPEAVWPPEYEGGIEKEGVEALKAFVESGGRLILLNQACGLAFSDFQPPARNAIERATRTQFFCPTSILKLRVDPTTPIGYGFGETAAAVFADSLAMDTSSPPYDWDRKVVASYPEKDVLLSGWLLGEDQIARKAAVVDTAFKKGRIVLIGIRSQHRAQSHGTYKFILNALLYPEKG